MTNFEISPETMAQEDSFKDGSSAGSSSNAINKSGANSTNGSQMVDAMEASDEPMIVDDIAPNNTISDTRASKSARKRRKKQERNKNLKHESRLNSDPNVTTDHQSLETALNSEIKSGHNSTTKGNKSQNETTLQSKTRAKNLKLGTGSHRNDMENPQQIVEYILNRSEFKTPNLSQLVMEKFEASDYKEMLQRELSDIEYVDKIHSIDIQMSVLPTRYSSHTVSIYPHAITSLCPVEKPVHVRARKRAREQVKRASNPPPVQGNGSQATQQKSLENGISPAQEPSQQPSQAKSLGSSNQGGGKETRKTNAQHIRRPRYFFHAKPKGTDG